MVRKEKQRVKLDDGTAAILYPALQRVDVLRKELEQLDGGLNAMAARIYGKDPGRFAWFIDESGIYLVIQEEEADESE